MGKFNEYTQKATPADNDTLMIYDATSKANKLSPFSGIWNWIVEKLTNAVISNLQTNNQTVLGAINEVNGSLPAGGIYDLDNPPKKMIFSAMAGSTNLPNDFGGANAVTVIQMNLGGGNFDAMIAFTFAVDKIAIRRKNGTENWSEWKYFNTSEILSNLTTTNKSSLVGAINELNSNPFLRYERTFGESLTIKNVRAATHGLIMIEKTMVAFYLGGSTSIGYTVTTSALPDGITISNSDRTVTIKSTKTQMITCFYAFL
jgi:hypothetical protein